MDISEAGLKISEAIKNLELPREYAMCVLVYNVEIGGLVTTSNVNRIREIAMCKLAVDMLENHIPADTFVLKDQKKRD